MANGRVLNVNHETEPDLYWALRGGGANFGIVTSFDIETHPIGQVWGDFNAQIASDVAKWVDTSKYVARWTTLQGEVLSWILPYISSFACKFGFCSSIDTLLQQTWDILEGTKDDLDSQSYGFVTVMTHISVTGFHMVNSKGDAEVPAYTEARKGRKIMKSARVAHGLSPFADEMSTITSKAIDR